MYEDEIEEHGSWLLIIDQELNEEELEEE